VQIQRVWDALEKAEKLIPDVAFEAAERLVILGGDAAVSRRWVLPVWESMVSGPDALALPQRIRLARVLERGFDAPGGAPDAEWLNRIETAQMGNPRDAVLQYLAGVVCMRLSLWGKAQQLLKQSLSLSQESELRRDAWLALAQMADQRQDVQVAAQAYREAAKK
jgi:HemY protein